MWGNTAYSGAGDGALDACVNFVSAKPGKTGDQSSIPRQNTPRWHLRPVPPLSKSFPSHSKPDRPKLPAKMPRTDEAAAFYHAVYCAIQEVPRGRVTTYGHIAALIGTRASKPPPIPTVNTLSHRAEILNSVPTLTESADRPRQVGICLKHLPQDPEAEFNSETVPWQRVINSKGGISPR